MSHLKERKEKDCLNCKTEVVGRYCHNCGQENLIPKETVWHLVQHFFNDITHFDGKFFASVKYLIRKPGFLSLEYMAGRRMSYLNPIRMYVFTSAIFFIFLYSLKKPEDFAGDKKERTHGLADMKREAAGLETSIRYDDDDEKGDDINELKDVNVEIAMVRKLYGDSTKMVFTKQQRRQLRAQAYRDSMSAAGITEADRKRFDKEVRKAENAASGSNFFGLHQGEYASVEEYDSTERALSPDLRDGWLKRTFMHRMIELDEHYTEDPSRFKEHVIENIFHSFPKILFVSLPIFAMILNILYFRHKKYYYVDHGIFSIHVYIATFILLLVMLLLGRLEGAVRSLHWLKILIDVLIFAVGVYMMIYLYKAMRGFYQQRRAKTFLKYFIVFSVASVINLLLFIIFVMISVFSI